MGELGLVGGGGFFRNRANTGLILLCFSVGVSDLVLVNTDDSLEISDVTSILAPNSWV